MVPVTELYMETPNILPTAGGILLSIVLTIPAGMKWAADCKGKEGHVCPKWLQCGGLHQMKRESPVIGRGCM